MKKHIIIALSALTLMACEQQTNAPAVVQQQETPAAAVIAEPVTPEPTVESTISNRSGKVLFDLHCAGCHNPGTAHAATKQLALVRGKDLAVIMQRKDLTPAYIKYVVRDGLLEMPPFRPTDLNNSELDNLSNYIVDNAKAYVPKEGK